MKEWEPDAALPGAGLADRPLLAPVKLGSRQLRNRVVFGAHTTNLAEDGVPGARMTQYAARAAIAIPC